ncbi:AraC family transcriptional regulator [Metallumcola ferriviriculae]|uniref:AraC family transcriptional regulator n=1 Tax=Metallumcola ferriviriculae TaxID=3039180 RepID=A0AAU0USB0_9FIRM|nr:AraC family transcriptional regulator [Desulfitibacteraceae bacterium MK1]
MEDLKKKIAYLQGLMAGLEMDPATKEGKLFQGMLEVLDEMAETMDDLYINQDELEDYMESIDEDLYDLEDEYYLADEDFDEEFEEDIDDEFYDDEEDMDLVEVECPDCGDTLYFDANILDDDDYVEVTCPNCETVVFVNDDDYEITDEPGDDEGPGTDDI